MKSPFIASTPCWKLLFQNAKTEWANEGWAGNKTQILNSFSKVLENSFKTTGFPYPSIPKACLFTFEGFSSPTRPHNDKRGSKGRLYSFDSLCRKSRLWVLSKGIHTYLLGVASSRFGLIGGQCICGKGVEYPTKHHPLWFVWISGWRTKVRYRACRNDNIPARWP